MGVIFMELNRKKVDELLALDDNALREKAEKVARAAGMGGNLPDISKIRAMLSGVSDEDIDKIQATGLSNSQQYRMAGNSIVVNVLEAIFRNLFEEEIL